VAIVVGVSWAFVYVLAWIPLMHEHGISQLFQAIEHPRLLSSVWWRDFLSPTFDVLIILVAIVGTWWSLGHFAAEARNQRKWRLYYKSEEGRRDVWVLRFTLWQRIQHLWMMITLIIVAFTGFAMYFANDPYWKYLMPSRDLYVKIHVVTGWAMGVLIILHFTYYLTRMLLDKLAGKSLMEEYPMLQFYTIRFYKNLLKRLAWTIKRGVERPLVDKYDCEQLFEYWGVYWGIAVLGIPGAIMSVVGPGALNGALWVMHTKEAVLAVTFLLMVHIAYTHFLPTVFPMDPTYINGRMPLKRVKEEHPLWYERLVRKGIVGAGGAGGG